MFDPLILAPKVNQIKEKGWEFRFYGENGRFKFTGSMNKHVFVFWVGDRAENCHRLIESLIEIADGLNYNLLLRHEIVNYNNGLGYT